MEIEKGDTVVLSARIIPGNEKNISRLIGHLYKRGANIIEEKRRLVHVSGHASQEDIRIMVETVAAEIRRADPRRIPHAVSPQRSTSRTTSPAIRDDNIILIENGNVLEIDEFGAQVVEKHELHKTFIDEESIDEIEYDIVRERKETRLRRCDLAGRDGR